MGATIYLETIVMKYNLLGLRWNLCIEQGFAVAIWNTLRTQMDSRVDYAARVYVVICCFFLHCENWSQLEFNNRQYQTFSRHISNLQRNVGLILKLDQCNSENLRV